MKTAIKRQFIIELLANVQKELLAKLPQVPEEWDGHELRQWIAGRFQDAADMSKCMKDRRSKRRKDFDNEVIMRNL